MFFIGCMFGISTVSLFASLVRLGVPLWVLVAILAVFLVVIVSCDDDDDNHSLPRR